MNLPRVSLRVLMAALGLVVLELTGVRALMEYDAALLFAIALSGPAIQVGLFRLIRSRHPARLFWAGFVASGMLATLSCLDALERPGSESLWAMAWGEYLRVIDDYVVDVYQSGFSIPGHPSVMQRIAESAGIALVYAVPQLLAALLGGMLARFAGWPACAAAILSGSGRRSSRV